jgi:hypothetical protein
MTTSDEPRFDLRNATIKDGDWLRHLTELADGRDITVVIDRKQQHKLYKDAATWTGFEGYGNREVVGEFMDDLAEGTRRIYGSVRVVVQNQ